MKTIAPDICPDLSLLKQEYISSREEEKIILGKLKVIKNLQRTQGEDTLSATKKVMQNELKRVREVMGLIEEMYTNIYVHGVHAAHQNAGILQHFDQLVKGAYL